MAVLRTIVGLIFMISGFVKAVDPVGFSFKLEEYFGATVFNLPFLEQFSMPIAILISGLEVVLGLMLILKIKLKPVLLWLISLCVFFAFLTFYSAYFNVVTDCGCFGDAVRFTPWQSFTKDILLLLLLLVLWFYHNQEKSTPNFKLKYGILALAILALAWVISRGIFHEPLIDFRDYKIGTDLRAERKNIAAQPSEYKTFYVLKNKRTGEEKKVNQDDYLADKSLWATDSPWEIQSGKTTSEIVKEGYRSEISKFKIIDIQGNDLTDQILNAPESTLVSSYKPNAVSPETFAKIEEKVKAKKGMVVGVSTTGTVFQSIKNATMDGTAIKTIARSNPFVLTLRYGIIADKRSAADY